MLKIQQVNCTVESLMQLKEAFNGGFGTPLEKLLSQTPYPNESCKLCHVNLGNLTAGLRMVPDMPIDLLVWRTIGEKDVNLPVITMDDCKVFLGPPQLFDVLVEIAQHPENRNGAPVPVI